MILQLDVEKQLEERMVRFFTEKEEEYNEDLEDFYELLNSFVKEPKDTVVLNFATTMLNKKSTPEVQKQTFEDLKAFCHALHPSHKEAYFLLGLCFQFEFGTKENPYKAFYCYELAAKEKCPFGLYCLGSCFYEGYGIEENETKGLELLAQAAEQDLFPAINFLQGLIFKTKETEETSDTLKCLKNACQQGLKNSQYALGQLYIIGKGVPQDFQEGIKLLTRAAEQGQIDAKYCLATLYEGDFSLGGKSIEKNIELAISLLNEAAALGSKEALDELGDLYLDGTGVEKDLKKAFDCYLRSAELGHNRAFYSLGICYEKGYSIEKDLKKAAACYRKGAILGCEKCQIELGDCYVDGIGVEKNKEEALKWYERAAKEDEEEAHYKIGLLFWDSSGNNIADNLRAAKHFKKAVLENYSRSQFMLAHFYYCGTGIYSDKRRAILLMMHLLKNEQSASYEESLKRYMDSIPEHPKSLEETIALYKEQASQGDGNALQLMGFCYHYGLGVPKDLKVAISYYKQSIEKGQYTHACLWDLVECYDILDNNEEEDEEIMEFLNQLIQVHRDPMMKREAMMVLSHIYYEGLLNHEQNLLRAYQVFERNWRLIDDEKSFQERLKVSTTFCIGTHQEIPREGDNPEDECFRPYITFSYVICLFGIPTAPERLSDERMRTLSFLPTFHQFLNGLPHFGGVKDLSQLVAEYALEAPNEVALQKTEGNRS